MSNDYEHLDLVLLPGEHVIYKAKRGIAKLNLASWLITTNKRLIVANKRLFASTYNSIFYSNISMVSMRKGILGSKIILALSDGKSKLSSVRFVKKLQALSLFSILSNQVSTKTDMQLYQTNLNDLQQRKSMASESFVVESIDAGNAMFAEMLKRVELNAESKKSPVLKNIMRKEGMDAEEKAVHARINSNNSIPASQDANFKGLKTFSHVVEAPTHEVFLKGSNVFVYNTNINESNLVRHDNSIITHASVSKPEAHEDTVPFAVKGKLDPDHDMIIFKHRRVGKQLSFGSGTKDTM
ncbi:MAG: PH domain-containing protein [Candidatus Micrarchaeia archaeon]